MYGLNITAALVLVVASTSALATTTYSYRGAPYEDFGDSPIPEGVTYTPSNSLRIDIVLDEPLPLDLDLETSPPVVPVSYFFDDGSKSVGSESGGPLNPQFRFSTDGLGVITEWDVELAWFAPGPPRPRDPGSTAVFFESSLSYEGPPEALVLVGFDSSRFIEYCDCWDSDSAVGFIGTDGGGVGAGGPLQQGWVLIPEPATAALVSLGLGVCSIRSRATLQSQRF